VEFSNITLKSEKEEELGLVGSPIHYFTGGIIIGIAENLLSKKQKPNPNYDNHKIEIKKQNIKIFPQNKAAREAHKMK